MTDDSSDLWQDPVIEEFWDLWQDPIPIANPDSPRRHLPKHDCPWPEVEFGEFAPIGDAGPTPPATLDHIVLIDPEGNYAMDQFVANYIGPRGLDHIFGNLCLRRAGLILATEMYA